MKMVDNFTIKKSVGVFLLLMLCVFSISSVVAITGSIGNARMILRAETGDTLEKYILVKNVNDIALDIELSAVGDLAEYIKIQEDKFTLEPNSEKMAYFTVKVKKSGTTEGKINVMFAPTDGGSGVGLSSTVIVIAEGEDDNSWFGWGDNDKPDNIDDIGNEDNNVSVNFGGGNNNQHANFSISPIAIGLLVTALMLIIFIGLLVFALKYTKKGIEKENIKPKKSSVRKK